MVFFCGPTYSSQWRTYRLSNSFAEVWEGETSLGLNKLPSVFALPVTATAILPSPSACSLTLPTGPGNVPATYVLPGSSAWPTTKLVLPLSPSFNQRMSRPFPSHFGSDAFKSLVTTRDVPSEVFKTRISDVFECVSKE